MIILPLRTCIICVQARILHLHAIYYLSDSDIIHTIQFTERPGSYATRTLIPPEPPKVMQKTDLKKVRFFVPTWQFSTPGLKLDRSIARWSKLA
jgi:hypothetical protein